MVGGGSVRRKAGRRPLRLERLEPRTLVSSLQPTGQEQLLLELLNEARSNPARYGHKIGVDLSDVPPAQPLAFNTTLIAAARGHSQDMNARHFFAHVNPDGLGPGDRIDAAGYNWLSWAESIAAGQPSPAAALKSLITDQGVPDLGHRRHLLALSRIAAEHHEVGIGIVLNGSGPYGNYYTIDSATDARPADPILTGVVWSDRNGNGRYSPGEGYRRVKVKAIGPITASTKTYRTGGYSLPLVPGTYRVIVSGGTLPGRIRATVRLGGDNVKRDFVPGEPAGQPLRQDMVGVYVDARHWRLDTSGNGRWSRGLGGDTLVRRFGRWHNCVPVPLDYNGDGRDELAVFRNGRTLIIDANHNFRWDKGTDRSFRLGNGGDQLIAGDWNGDGRDEPGLIRDETGTFWLDTNGNYRLGGADRETHFVNLRPGDVPIAGDWNGDGRDEIGLFRLGPGGHAIFLLDANGNGRWEGGTVDKRVVLRPRTFTSAAPAVGNFDSDRATELAVFTNRKFYIDRNGDGRIDRITVFTRGDYPAVGNWG